jgi:hypothetical protein
MRKRRELLAQLADLDAQPIDPPAPRSTRRVRIPQWCRPFWERRDGRQHIVYTTAQRRGDREPTTAYWVFRDGQAVAKAATMQDAKTLALLRSFAFDTFVWDAEQWDEYKRSHPEIEEKLREVSTRRRGNDETNMDNVSSER